MIQLQINSPLKWPNHTTPTDRLARGMNKHFPLSMTELEAIEFLKDEFERTPQIESAKLYTNAQNLNSTMPTKYLSQNTGVSLYLRINGLDPVLCCDKWQSIAHNIYALHLAIRQFRQISEWGIGSFSHLLAGFVEGEPDTAHTHTAPVHFVPGTADWQIALDLYTNSSLEDANNSYRHKAKAVGTHDLHALQDLNIAIQKARNYFKSQSETD